MIAVVQVELRSRDRWLADAQFNLSDIELRGAALAAGGAELIGNDAKRFAFPRPMLGRADANFSLSGLKTAVRNEASRITPLEPQDVSDLCASFQAAVLESTADRLTVGLKLFREQFGPPRALVAAGGVAAN